VQIKCREAEQKFQPDIAFDTLCAIACALLRTKRAKPSLRSGTAKQVKLMLAGRAISALNFQKNIKIVDKYRI
jgi:hypothetical protein